MKLTHNLPRDVEKHYELWTDRYIENFGSFFQALQTSNPEDLMYYIAENCNVQDGMNILDAGCGVGGPAIALVKKYVLDIEAITLSEVQVQHEKNLLMKTNALKGSVNFKKMDFHNIAEHYPANHFDVIYFLESLVHSHDPEKVIQAVREVLKPNGVLYIKDLYKGPQNSVNPEFVDFAIQATDEQFCFNTQNIGDLLNILLNYGFRLDYCRTPEVEQDFSRGNAFTAKYLFKLRMDQQGPWRDEGLSFYIG